MALLLDRLTAGQSTDEILADYPQLKREDLYAAMAHGAEMSRDRYVDVPMEVVS